MSIDFLSMIIEQGVIIIPCLYIVGMILKGLQFIPDKFIPVILLPLGVLGTCSLAGSFGPENVVQGILVTGAAVYTNNIIKQLPKSK